ncbi:SH3 domain-containing protein [Viridibacillus sp. YIM B01967]|uniref:SH3 domain-containing protein n=1 Tax=Viridibacillus soli TaxID=2798301 RepID=A0ABS1HC19_9BACL|nr:SH3 domain-containing protein [Viridibacillus soli]MBK3496866.1 SH3 domain-containing protein [Viridibacillus soli]
MVKRLKYVITIVLLMSSLGFSNLPKVEAKADITIEYVKVEVLNVREKATISSKKLGQLKKNVRVAVISTSKGWSKIQYKEGTAYVSSDYFASKAVQNVTGKLAPKVGKYTYNYYEEGVYQGKSTDIFIKIKEGVKTKSNTGVYTSYFENSKFFTYLSPLGHTDFQLNYPLKKGMKWGGEQDKLQIQNVNATVKIAAGTFKNVVIVRMDHTAYNTYSHYYIAPGKGIIMWKLNGEKKFQLAEYTK